VKVGEVKSTHCLCAVIIYLSQLYKCQIFFTRRFVKIYKSIDNLRICQLIIADNNTTHSITYVYIKSLYKENNK